MELAAIAFVTSLLAAQASGITPLTRAQGPTPVPGHSNSAFYVDPETREVPVNLPTIEPRTEDPPSLPWDDVGDDMLFAQGDRYIEMHVPDIYIPKQEVPTEPEKVHRDPLYPDDLRAYDVDRSRNQQILTDASNRNYALEGYHIPYSVKNATHQEVSQSLTLAGRRSSEYTSGGTDINPVITNIKNPTAQIVRRQNNHWIDDRTTYQTWDKKQAAELLATNVQPALVQKAAINEPTQWIEPSRVRAFPKYINAFENQHGWRRLPARDQRGEIASYDTLKMKRLLLLGDQGFPSSQVTFYGAYDGALKYPKTGRRREILPAVSNPGLFQGGTGFTNRYQNTGNPLSHPRSDEVQTRDVIVPNVWGLTEIEGLGRSLSEHTEPPFRLGFNQNPTVDFIKQPVVHPVFYDKAEPHWWADNVSVVVPLHR